MKNCMLALLFSVPVMTGFAQNNNNNIPAVSQEALAKISGVQEMIPLAYHYFINWSNTVKYESVEIVAISNGKSQSLTSKGSMFTKEQKLLLISADPGSEIAFNIHFKHLPLNGEPAKDAGKEQTIDLPVRAIPAYQAEYPGGPEKLAEFLTARMTEKLANPWQPVKFPEAMILFTINEQGHATDIRLEKSTGNDTTDKLLIESMGKMQKWQPAQNSKGENIRQVMKWKFPYKNDGC